MTQSAPTHAKDNDLVEELDRALGREVVFTGADEIGGLLRDQSWLSPQLSQERSQRSLQEGVQLGVKAAIAPRSEQELATAISIAARRRAQITLRGAGTTNFGLINPKHGGLLFDLRGLTGELMVAPGAVRVPAGAVFGHIESLLRMRGDEVPVLTTTYASATVAGWLAGGHVGLGSSTHGAVWDGLVQRVRLMTVEETPRVLTLSGEEVEPVLHTFGVTGVLLEADLKTAPARDWVEAVGLFPSFTHASAFTTEISTDPVYFHRVVAAQEEALTPGLKVLAPILRPGACVLTILDRSQLAAATRLATTHGGELVEWQSWSPTGGEKPSIALLVYGHRMLWVKRMFPDVAFIHIYPIISEPDRSLAQLKQRFGDRVLLESKFIRSPWLLRAMNAPDAATLPAAVMAVRDGSRPDQLSDVLKFCDEIGIQYQNPHVHTIEENGLFKSVRQIVELKSESDPYNLIHRGRLSSAVTKP